MEGLNSPLHPCANERSVWQLLLQSCPPPLIFLQQSGPAAEVWQVHIMTEGLLSLSVRLQSRERLSGGKSHSMPARTKNKKTHKKHKEVFQRGGAQVSPQSRRSLSDGGNESHTRAGGFSLYARLGCVRLNLWSQE